MQVTDQSYLDQYRALTKIKREIMQTIQGFGAICESLKTWEKTASELATLPRNRPEWSEDNLNKILGLRHLLVKFHQESEKLAVIWRALPEDQKCGLAELGTIQLP